MKKIIAMIAIATCMPVFAQNFADTVRVEVMQGQNSKSYVLQAQVDGKQHFLAEHTENAATHTKVTSGFTFSLEPTAQKNHYLVSVKDLSSAGYSSFNEDDSFVSKNITMVSHQSQEVVVSDNLKFKITFI